jgi:signal transduction histidine kinase
MKTFLLIFLVFATPVFAQTEKDATFYLNELRQNDTVLSGWKFHAGDDPHWAEPGFDDSKWEPVDPAQDITSFNKLKQAGIGWIRLHIRIGSALANKQLAARVFQYTASELYVDGKLVKKYGTITTDPTKTVAMCPAGDLFLLHIDTGQDHVIAVRLAYQSLVPYTSPALFTLPAFTLNVNSFPAALANYQQLQSQSTVAANITGGFAGIFFIIGLIYFIYFFFDRQKRVNLYYVVFSLNLCCDCILITLFWGNIQNVAAQMWVSILVSFFVISAFWFVLLPIYALFEYRSRMVFKVLLFIAGAFSVFLFFSEMLATILALVVFPALCLLEGARVSLQALKTKRKESLVILAGILISITLTVWQEFLNQAELFTVVLVLLSFTGFPLAMSVYQGIQNAQTNRKLRLSLAEVQTLSAQNLLKEQEKQQILADQNEQLERQVTARTVELNQSLSDLRSTQAQLIQSEKMASLGELTAGIAHEIQNPLNFVNNFSEVSNEMLDEMKTELASGNLQLATEITDDVKGNLEKIIYHGKRADAIVKGMLQHSRASSGQKELTDINKLADEYLRLSYHGMRARDKSFDSEFETDFDETIGKINVVPQDIGRVLLNLFNNAFYAVNEKKKTADEDYEPTVSVVTKRINSPLEPAPTSRGDGGIEIRVADNGNGIPQNIVDKIFQPFFTTKPTGQGTGLGLSLAYDIIKAHGGEIKVETKEGEASEFVIQLPII